MEGQEDSFLSVLIIVARFRTPVVSKKDTKPYTHLCYILYKSQNNRLVLMMVHYLFCQVMIDNTYHD
jgi:hypothetical protein